MTQALSFTVSGRVAHTDLSLSIEARALELKLTGWCRDDFDTVVGTGQGVPEALEEFKVWLSGGVPGARIDVVEWETAAVREDRIAFRRQILARKD